MARGLYVSLKPNTPKDNYKLMFQDYSKQVKEHNKELQKLIKGK